jgi:N-acetylglutamate synthase-like GNAT family acetyltransferase
VVVDDPSRIPAAFDEAERLFQGQGLTCLRWAPAGGHASDKLAGFLVSRGFRLRTYFAMALTRWVDIEVASDVRVLPARAMRAALHKTLPGAASAAPSATLQLLVDAYEERLDDPQFDMFVALVENQAAGRCALFQVGDIARLMDLDVLARFANRGVDAALTAHVLALAKRLAMRTICVQIDSDDGATKAWFESVGFVEDGTIVEFERDPPSVGGDTR